MKSLVIIASFFFLSFTLQTKNVIERLGVKGPIEFNKTTFKLLWTDKPNDKYYIQEYVPAGEDLKSFNQMLTLHLFDNSMTTEKAVQQKLKELEGRKKTDPICNYLVTESPDGKEFIVDFLLSESSNDKMTVVEFNIYRYKQIELGNNRKGILVYAYSKRSYNNDITNFLKSLKDDRMNYLNQMVSADIPQVTLLDK